MFKPHTGICICHNEERLIVVKKGYCAIGNYEQKQSKKKAAGKKTGKYTYKREATGEAELFEEIASEREWICFVTGQPLRELTPTSFMHVLPKALNKYPKFKLHKPNIQLVADEIHYKWDHTPRSECRKDPRFDKLFKLEEELIEEYNSLFKK